MGSNVLPTMILFGVKRLMKYKLKTRLFAALALSGVSFYWPTSTVLAQEGDFGFIRAAETARQDVQKLNVPPITQSNPPINRLMPPIVSGNNLGLKRRKVLAASFQPPITQAPVAQAPATQAPATQARVAQAPIAQSANRQARASSPVPFAASNVFNGAYVQSENAGLGYAPQAAPSAAQESSTAQQVAYNQPASSSQSSQAPIGSGIQAQRDVPPIVASTQSTVRREAPQIMQPLEQNELPPILSSVQTANDSVVPIVTPKSGADRLLGTVPKVVAGTGDGGMIQDSFLLNADGKTIDGSSNVEPASAFGASPLLVQDAPPIINGSVQAIEPGSLPSADGLLVPVDPAVDLPFERSVESFPRATPLDSAVPRSVVDSGLPLEATSQPRPGFAEPPVQQPITFGNSVVGNSPVGGCSTCGTSGSSCGCNGGNCGANGVSGCSSCGENDCFDQAAVDNMFNTSGSNAYARRYFIAEALYLDRDDGEIFNSNRGSLSDFDFGGGARITVGRRQDSTSGREFQYSGTEKIEQTLRISTDDGSAQSLFLPSGTITGADTTSFFNATEQEQAKESYFHSLEFNKVKWGWDVIKSYVGVRYLYFDDEYNVFSQSRRFTFANDGFAREPQNGQFQQSATNNLIGPQIGGELYYDVGYRWSVSGFSRLGAYVNFNENERLLINNGVRVIDEEDFSTTVSYTYEAGISAKYRMSSQAQFRIGYNIYFWDELATVSDNLVNSGFGVPLTSSFLGNQTSDSDSVFFHGLSVGVEIYR